MTERDWEASARARLERLVAETVSRVRDAADQIERDARGHIASAAKGERDIEFQTYPRVAAQAIHTVQTLVFNIGMENLIDAGADAEAAWTEKRTAEKVAVLPEAELGDIMTARLNGATNALAAMERAVKGWAQGAVENDEALGRRDRKPSDEQPFVLADILNMIDDAAREVGVTPVYSEEGKR
jgi:hypothetical protein